MIITSKILAPVIFVFFIIGIAGTMTFSLWQIESSKEPAKYEEGDFADMNNPGDIRGSYTLADVKKVFDIDVEILGKAFGLDDIDDLDNFKCKELEEMYDDIKEGEIGTDTVRMFVALYKGLPFTPEEDTLLPSPTVAILKDKVGEEEFLKLKERSISLSQFKTEDSIQEDIKKDTDKKITEEVQTKTEQTEPDEDRTIRGKTTFGELKKWGLSKEEIEKVMGQPIGKSGESARDFCKAKDIEFSSIKTELQKLVDSKK